jgi:hypothetical protein
MKLTRQDLRWAVEESILQRGQDEQLWQALERRSENRPRFDAANVTYYAGALVVLGAMGWFFTEAWERLPGIALTGIAVVYAAVFVLAGRWLWDRLGLRVPGGLLYTVAVGMTPLAIYGVLRQFGLWPHGDPGKFRGFHEWVKGSWIALEFGTIVAGAIALRFRRFPFLTAPIAVALWYLSMDLAPLMLNVPNWSEREWVSIWFGLVMLVVAYAVDRRRDLEDFAFWLYLFGLVAFWGGLSLLDSNSELGRFLYCLINVGLIAVSLVLRRVAFVVFGACGVTGYIGYLAYRIFEDSMLFSLALTFLGVALIALGVIYQRNRRQIEHALHARVPAWCRDLLPPHARG